MPSNLLTVTTTLAFANAIFWSPLLFVHAVNKKCISNPVYRCDNRGIVDDEANCLRTYTCSAQYNEGSYDRCDSKLDSVCEEIASVDLCESSLDCLWINSDASNSDPEFPWGPFASSCGVHDAMNFSTLDSTVSYTTTSNLMDSASPTSSHGCLPNQTEICGLSSHSQNKMGTWVALMHGGYPLNLTVTDDNAPDANVIREAQITVLQADTNEDRELAFDCISEDFDQTISIFEGNRGDIFYLFVSPLAPSDDEDFYLRIEEAINSEEAACEQACLNLQTYSDDSIMTFLQPDSCTCQQDNETIAAVAEFQCEICTTDASLCAFPSDWRTEPDTQGGFDRSKLCLEMTKGTEAPDVYCRYYDGHGSYNFSINGEACVFTDRNDDSCRFFDCSDIRTDTFIPVEYDCEHTTEGDAVSNFVENSFFKIYLPDFEVGSYFETGRCNFKRTSSEKSAGPSKSSLWTTLVLLASICTII